MMNLAQAYTYASLVCMGTDLHVGMVSAMHMLGLLVVQAAFCVSSGVPNFAIASSDITVAILNHKIVREVYSVASRVPPQARHDTAICALCLCTVVQGILYLALGRMRAAEMVQYWPHPVTAGVLASTGCAIVRGALAVTTGIDVSAPSTEHSLLTLIAAWPQQLIAAALLALLVVHLSARFNPATAFLLLVRAALRHLRALHPAQGQASWQASWARFAAPGSPGRAPPAPRAPPALGVTLGVTLGGPTPPRPPVTVHVTVAHLSRLASPSPNPLLSPAPRPSPGARLAHLLLCGGRLQRGLHGRPQDARLAVPAPRRAAHPRSVDDA